MRVLFALLLALTLGQPEEPAPQTLRQVAVPVVVHDSRDRALPALTPSDFQVRDRDAALRIVDVTYVAAIPASGTSGA